MTKIFLMIIIGLFLISFNSSAQTKLIGKILYGKTTLTIDKPILIKNFNRNLFQRSNIDGQFKDVTIESYDNNKSYYLIFTGLTYKSTFRIIQTESVLYVDTKTTCTSAIVKTSSNGCIPTFEDGYSYCTACLDKSKCTKTVSTTSLLD